MSSKKYYVVWAGRDSGVFDSWEECRLQVENFPNAKYKSFSSQEEAIAAYRGETLKEDLQLISTIASHTTPTINYTAFPEINMNGIAVDASCPGNPGPVEYRGVSLSDAKELFRVGPLANGSNNLGEFLAIVHALALLEKHGRSGVTVYTDSKTALAWLRNKKVRTTIVPTPENLPLRQLIDRALTWLSTHSINNPVVKWDTEKWGEIPADFGRK